MKQEFRKKPKIGKGMPSAVVLSILIHAALFLLAGMLVVFTVVKKEEKRFEPPKAVDRPKMKLRKPKVRVKKTSKPKPTTRIVTKVNRASMPDIQLPEMSGMGDGLGGGLGGFDMMPDLGEVSVFGSGQSIGNDFVGTATTGGYQHRGQKYASYLVVVTDSRGKIIAHETPKKWLFENLENLREISVGNFIDETCTRVGPSRPKRFY